MPLLVEKLAEHANGITADTGALHNVCSIKFHSKHSSNTILHLLQNLMEQML